MVHFVRSYKLSLFLKVVIIAQPTCRFKNHFKYQISKSLILQPSSQEEKKNPLLNKSCTFTVHAAEGFQQKHNRAAFYHTMKVQRSLLLSGCLTDRITGFTVPCYAVYTKVLYIILHQENTTLRCSLGEKYLRGQSLGSHVYIDSHTNPL